MSAFKDETGKKFGKLTAISHYRKNSQNGKSRTYWICECECGNAKHMMADNLRKKDRIPSCGCYKSEYFSNLNSSHKLSKTRVYRSWASAKQRCINPNDTNYHQYGARGIKICDRWNSFENFLEDMGYPETVSLTIERIDVNGDYEPSNCRWATSKEQARNKTNTTFYEFNGKKMIITDWEEFLGIRVVTLRKRLEMGWSIERVFSKNNHIFNKPVPLSSIDME
ncbi:hypothetical protein VXQ12_05770 [Acinetobacter baumannii]|uniref:hypothetical protein n=1 Tax=Acinetobacter baumannii TaxID=470 RepID=UPI003A83BBE7